MALQAIKYGFPFPAYPTAFSGAPTFATMAITAGTHKAASVYSATAAKNIHKVHVRTATVTTGDTVDVRIETVDGAANGDPTGTLWATNTNGSIVIASSDDNVWKVATLTADATVAIGDVFAVVLANGGGGGNMQIAAYADHSTTYPYGDLFGAAWVKSNNAALLILEYSDGSFEPIFGVVDVGGPFNTSTFNSGSATNRRGNIFQVPFPCRVKGCWSWVDADGDYTVKLYDSGGTALATTATINNFQRVGAAAGILFHPFTTTTDLAKTTNYRVAVVPGTVTSLSTYDFDVPFVAMLDMFPGGQSCYASVFTSSAWVETTTRRGLLGVYLDAFDDATGAGSTGGGPVLFGRVLG